MVHCFCTISLSVLLLGKQESADCLKKNVARCLDVLIIGTKKHVICQYISTQKASYKH